MAQFLRFAALIIFAVIGFGSGICGLFGLGATALEALQGRGGGGENFTGPVVVLSIVGVLIAIGCFFAARAFARSRRAHTTPAVTLPPGDRLPHEPPSSPSHEATSSPSDEPPSSPPSA